MPETTIGGVPPEVQTLLWGDRDALMQDLLDLEAADEAAATALIERICLIDAQRKHYTKYVNAGGSRFWAVSTSMTATFMLQKQPCWR